MCIAAELKTKTPFQATIIIVYWILACLSANIADLAGSTVARWGIKINIIISTFEQACSTMVSRAQFLVDNALNIFIKQLDN